MVNWRKANRIDTLLQDMYIRQLTSILSRKLRFIEHGHDLLQRPLTIMAIGSFRLCDILKEYEIEDILMVFYYYTEYIERKCMHISRQLNRDYTGNVTLMDMEGLSLCTHLHPKAIAIFKTLVLSNTYYYPESCHRVYVVNSPPIFSFFWKLIYPLMNEMQYSKMHMINNLDELLNDFSPDQLPCHYGGNCQCEAEKILFGDMDAAPTTPSGVLKVPKNGLATMTQAVNEGDHVVISFSSLESDVFYTAFSKNRDCVHYYCQKRLAASNTTIVNVSFIIVTSGPLVLEFSSVDPLAQHCIIGYEIV
ncbi:hypothetical protein WA538_005971, partial [Blastocystis sp. DL]